MIARWMAKLGWLRHWSSRSERIIRWLGLSRSEGTGTAPGLLLVQIDGLSQRELLRAVAAGQMPFLKRLLEHEYYQLHTLYSGLPSSTPAVQAELFYGQRCAVPAFSFRDRDSGRVMRMFDSEAAQRVEERLSQNGPGLLEGGSAYSNIYAGAAAESHFCAATIGWSEMQGFAKPLQFLGLIALHFWSVIRVLMLVLIEAVIAVGDFCRGLVNGRDLWRELLFIPSRVAISILLREVTVIGATLDVSRGLPIVHLNLLGYDEQAHRRGPRSAFARWALKGIDDAVQRLATAARRSVRRDYDIWVYGDHGQEHTRPYRSENGLSIEQAIQRVFDDLPDTVEERKDVACPERECGAEAKHGIQFQRATWLRRRPRAQDILTITERGRAGRDPRFTVTAMGPVAHLYLADSKQVERASLAENLVRQANVPLVLFVAENDATQVTVYTAYGVFLLPDQAEQVLGSQHPFLHEVAQDLVRLCQHRDAGDLVLSGWRANGQSLTFAIENGAHAGPGAEETRAFALLPHDAPIQTPASRSLRFQDLRMAAQRLLGRKVDEQPRHELTSTSHAASPQPPPLSHPAQTPATSSRSHGGDAAATDILRVMTYNVHTCVGMDGKLSPRRIARVIRQCRADVITLQELDVGRQRTGAVDQARLIAQLLEMEFHFHPAWQLAEEQYGNAILSRFPMQVIGTGTLPQHVVGRRRAELRSALWTRIDVGARLLQVINTHLGLSQAERKKQVQALLGENWLKHQQCEAPLILCGDFNASPMSSSYRRLCRSLHDVQTHLSGHRPRATWFSSRPFNRIDHIFVSGDVTVRAIEVLCTELTRVASDHLPLVAELQLSAARKDR